MAREIKVYGTSAGSGRSIVATTSLTAASKLLGIGRDYISETGNDRELVVANSRPGVVFHTPDGFGRGDVWTPLIDRTYDKAGAVRVVLTVEPVR